MKTKYLKKAAGITYEYFIAKLLKQPTAPQFWYLPEIANITDAASLQKYKESDKKSVPYVMDYRGKLKFTCCNEAGIIIIPYASPIGSQINPAAAFQYALGLNDHFIATNNEHYFKEFFRYVDYFLAKQGEDGSWFYEFDWFESKAPWSSALAQSHGASVMLRAWLYTQDSKYLHAAKNAFSKFSVATSKGGFLENFTKENCSYFEEYPKAPRGVINGFMASLFGAWELWQWLDDVQYKKMWEMGVDSLEKMLPHYVLDNWTLYDFSARDTDPNINSPRYHNLMINYILIFSVLTDKPIFKEYYQSWLKQGNFKKIAKTFSKLNRKIRYK